MQIYNTRRRSDRDHAHFDVISFSQMREYNFRFNVFANATQDAIPAPLVFAMTAEILDVSSPEHPSPTAFWLEKEACLVLMGGASVKAASFDLNSGDNGLYDYFPFNVHVYLDEKHLEILEIRQAFDKIRLTIPMIHRDGRSIANIRISSELGARPCERGISDDVRELAVFVNNVTTEQSCEDHDDRHAATPAQSFAQTSEKRGPVFVIGCYRSGTSILTWALGQHPNIFAMEETGWLPSLYYGACLAYRTAAAPRRPATGIYCIEQDKFLRYQGSMIDKMHRKLSKERALSSIFERLSGKQGFKEGFQILRAPANSKKRWVDGTPENTTIAIGLAEMFPQAQFVFTIRHPFQAIRSMMNFSKAGGTDYSFSEAAEFWECFAQWGAEARDALGARLYLLPYDQIVKRPEAACRELWHFLREPMFRPAAATYATIINSSIVTDDFVFPDGTHALMAHLSLIYDEIVAGAHVDDISWRRTPERFADRRNHCLNEWNKMTCSP